MKTTSTSLFVLCVFVLPTTGCGDAGPEIPPLGSVTGVVTLDGQPLPEVMVMFQPKAGGRSSMGKTDATGNYILNFNSETPGAIIGDHAVSIRTPMETPNPGQKEAIPSVYNTKTLLLEKVSDGENTIDFDLKSKPSARP